MCILIIEDDTDITTNFYDYLVVNGIMGLHLVLAHAYDAIFWACHAEQEGISFMVRRISHTVACTENHPISLAKLAGQLRMADSNFPVCTLKQGKTDERAGFLAVQGTARQTQA